MKKGLMLAAAVMFGLVMVLGSNSVIAAKRVYVTIGTGGITGVYYPTGGAIAKMVNKKRDIYGIRATVESTGGSVFNVNAVMVGDLEFGVVQSDRQYQAINGIADWKDSGPQKDLRAVFSVHPESVTLVAAVDAGINSISDLKGKRVNIGNPGSGHRKNSMDALTAVGLDYQSDLKAESAKAAEAPSLLQDDRIDAFFYTVGHPSGAIKEATSGARKVKIVEIAGSKIAELVAAKSYYAVATIPRSLYPNAQNSSDITTFGVKATFVTSSKVPADIVYAITKEVFENFEDFKKLHPAYANLTKKSMLEGLSAPIHEGAMRYYKEAGLK